MIILTKKTSNTIKNFLKVLSEEEKEELLIWAEKCQKIQKAKYPIKRKFKEIAKITAEHKAIQNVFNIIWRQTQKNLWTDRSFVARAAVLGGAVGVFLGGFGGAGIAALGSAIGVPFFLVTAAGGAFLGMLIQELKQEKEFDGNKKESTGKESDRDAEGA